MGAGCDDGIVNSSSGDLGGGRAAQYRPVVLRRKRDDLHRAHEVRFDQAHSIGREAVGGRRVRTEYASIRPAPLRPYTPCDPAGSRWRARHARDVHARSTPLRPCNWYRAGRLPISIARPFAAQTAAGFFHRLGRQWRDSLFCDGNRQTPSPSDGDLERRRFDLDVSFPQPDFQSHSWPDLRLLP